MCFCSCSGLACEVVATSPARRHETQAHALAAWGWKIFSRDRRGLGVLDATLLEVERRRRVLGQALDRVRFQRVGPRSSCAA